jgi:hypothetical protein
VTFISMRQNRSSMLRLRRRKTSAVRCCSFAPIW